MKRKRLAITIFHHMKIYWFLLVSIILMPIPVSASDMLISPTYVLLVKGASGIPGPCNTNDCDNDGIPDDYELTNGLNPEDPSDALDDPDVDGLNNLEEYRLGTDPNDADTDDDGLKDLREDRFYNTNPLVADTDGDGLNDGVEVNWAETDPNEASSFSIGADDDETKQLMHIANRVSYGPTQALLDAIHPDNGKRLSQNFNAWLSSQFLTDGIRIRYYDEETGQTEDYYELSRRVRDGLMDVNRLPNGLPAMPSGQEVVDLDRVDYQNNSDLADFFYSFSANAGRALPQCSNDLFVVSDNVGNSIFQGSTAPASGSALSDQLARQALDLRDCLSGHLYLCENAKGPDGKLLNDPAQCRLDVERIQVINNAAMDGVGSGPLSSIRALHSNQSLRTVMGDFWDNHFHTNYRVLGDSVPEGGSTLALRMYDMDTYFMHAFGNFYDDLLLNSARSAAMLEFLDNTDSVASGPNENYAREVMELHTLGVINGLGEENYSQSDVYDLARILTGWQVEKSGNAVVPYRGRYKYYGWAFVDVSGDTSKEAKEQEYFNFYTLPIQGSTDHGGAVAKYGFNAAPGIHDTASKEFLEFSVNGSGAFSLQLGAEQEGEFALRALAYHPQTALHICNKLYNAFIGDGDTNVYVFSVTPTNDPLDPYSGASYQGNTGSALDTTVLECAQIFRTHRHSADQMQHVLQYLLTSAAFQSPASHRKLSKNAQAYVFSGHRLFEREASTTLNNHWSNRAGGILATTGMERAPFTHPEPDGLPLMSSEWETFDQVRRRFEVVRRLPDTHYVAYSAGTGLESNYSFRWPNPSRETNNEGFTESVVNENSHVTGIYNRSIYLWYLEQFGCPTPDNAVDVEGVWDDNVYKCVGQYNEALGKFIAQHMLKMVYGGYYSGADVQLIYDVLNPGYQEDASGREVFFSKVGFDDLRVTIYPDLYDNAQEKQASEREKRYRLQVLSRVILSVIENNLK